MVKVFRVKGAQAVYGLDTRVRLALAVMAVLLFAVSVLIISTHGLYPALPVLALALVSLVVVFYRDEWFFDNSERVLGDVLGFFIPATGREFAYDEVDGIEVSSFTDGRMERYTLSLILKKDSVRIDIVDGRDKDRLIKLAGEISGFTGLRFY